MATLYIDSGSFNNLQVTGSMIISASSGTVLQLRSSGSTIFSISGSAGEIFNISDRSAGSTALFSVASGSTTILSIDESKNVSVSGSLLITGSAYFRDLVTSSAAVTNVVMYGANGQLFTTASTAIGGGSGTPAFPFNGNAVITGSLLVSGSGLIVTGSLNAANITGSLLGTASFASNAIITQITTGSVVASVTPTQFSVASGSATELVVTGTGVSIGSVTTDSHRITGSLAITGSSFSVIGGTTEFQVQASGVKIGNAASDVHQVTGSLNAPSITGSLQGNASSADTAANGGVTSVDIVTGYPLAMNGGQTAGAVEIKTSYTQLLQIFSQTSATAPVPDYTLVNTTGDTYTWGYSNEGIYTLTADNNTPFTSGKTAIQLTAGGTTDKPVNLSYEYISTSQIKIYAWSSAESVLKDDRLIKATIDIKIFP